MPAIDKYSWGFFLFVFIIAAVVFASFWLAPGGFGVLVVAPEAVFSLLSLIFVVTLFVERVQEVMLTNWRAAGADALELDILVLERKLSRLAGVSQQSQEDLYAKLERLRLQRLNYRSRTRVLALRMGLVFGIAVSLAGVRTLEFLVPSSTVLAFGLAQQILFHSVDVILTGGVIAGGSDGIHKMAELYRVFVETKSKKEKRKLSPLKDK
ncbi:MAG: hypothetical protein CSA49_03400 [Gammaproteobacteria bacterium]|nr:MAG: hypothetical protein CSA49_03400 [Gammaproteobacteria bacterium]